MILQEDTPSTLSSLKERFKALFYLIPRLCLPVNLLAITLYALALFPSLYKFLAMTDSFFSGFIWTAATSGFFESNLFFFSYHLVLINIFAIKLSSIWTSRHFLLMTVFVNTSASFTYALFAFLTCQTFGTTLKISPECTLDCVLMCVLMSLRQNCYDSRLVTPIPWFKGYLKIAFKHFPHIQLVLNTAFAVLFNSSINFKLWAAFYFSWMYLRFYMKRDLSDSIGDPSRNFAFANFFLTPVARIIDPVATFIYRFARTIRVVPDIGTVSTGTMLDKTTSYEKKKFSFENPEDENRALQNIETEMEALISDGKKRQPLVQGEIKEDVYRAMEDIQVETSNK